jgi:hypothetical protein
MRARRQAHRDSTVITTTLAQVARISTSVHSSLTAPPVERVRMFHTAAPTGLSIAAGEATFRDANRKTSLCRWGCAAH